MLVWVGEKMINLIPKNCEEVQCVVCNKKYIRSKDRQNRRIRTRIVVRSRLTKTCSRRCSRIYTKLRDNKNRHKISQSNERREKS